METYEALVVKAATAFIKTPGVDDIVDGLLDDFDASGDEHIPEFIEALKSLAKAVNAK